MKTLARIFAYVVYLAGFAILLIMQTNKYDWMHDMDPSIPAGSIQDTGNAAIFALFVLIVIAIAQLILLLATRKKLEKILSAGLILLAFAVWAVRFW